MNDMKRLVTGLPKPRTDDDVADDISHDEPSVRRQTLYMPPRVHDQLRELAFTERKSQQRLIREALNMLFADRGCATWDELK